MQRHGLDGGQCDQQAVELSVTPQAFVADVNNITIQNLTIEKYASFQQQGAVDVHGNGWIVNNDEIRLNHAIGVKAYAIQRPDSLQQSA